MAAATVRVRAELVSSRPMGGLVQLTFAAGGQVLARPGQLVAVAPARASGQLLPTVTWIHGAGQHPTLGDSLDLLLEPADPANAWLLDLATGAPVLLTGPLGRGFRLPARPVPALLVGQAASSAPLIWLSSVLRERGCRTQVVLVAESVDDLPGVVETRRACDDLVLATADGVAGGGPADVDQVLVDVLDRTEAAVAYLTGEADHVSRWAADAERAGLVGQVGLTAGLCCGTGLCDACRIPVLDSGGRVARARLCAEGPL